MKFKKALTVAMASISLMGCTTFATQTVKADKHPFSYWYHYSHSDYLKHDSSIEIKYSGTADAIRSHVDFFMLRDQF